MQPRSITEQIDYVLISITLSMVKKCFITPYFFALTQLCAQVWACVLIWHTKNPAWILPTAFLFVFINLNLLKEFKRNPQRNSEQALEKSREQEFGAALAVVIILTLIACKRNASSETIACIWFGAVSYLLLSYTISAKLLLEKPSS